MKKNQTHTIVNLLSPCCRPLSIIVAGVVLIFIVPGAARAENNGVAATPGMGWSSWSFLRNAPSEAKIEAQAAAMHSSALQSHGFSYVNLDDFWYLNPSTTVDSYGRWVVDTSKFPDGMAAVASYVHSLGLQFGIYVTPGIPAAAYNENTPIEGTSYTARQIVDSTSTSENNYNFGAGCMYYIDYTKPGAQAFVNSWADLFASWGVDYLKIDGVGDSDIPDVEAWSTALAQSGRPIHLELSNSLDYHNGSIWKEYSNGWRIDNDIECYCSSSGSYPLTDWTNVSYRFSDEPNFTPYGGPGAWNDLDSLELGNGSNDGLTTTQRQTMFSLWAISNSSLILGSDLTNLDSGDMGLLTNDRVLQIDQNGVGPGAPLTYNTTTQVWRAYQTDGSFAVALFNLGSSTATVSVNWSQLGFTGSADVRDAWSGNDLGMMSSGVSVSLPSQGAALYRVAPTYTDYRYLAATSANTIAGGAGIATSQELSNGQKVGFIGNGGTLTFNGITAPAAGTYDITFLYENGDSAARTGDISVNSGTATAESFPVTGSWSTLASLTMSVPLNSGSNTIEISNPSGWAPDYDSLVVQSSSTSIGNGTYILRPACAPAVVLDDSAGGTTNGNPVITWPANNGANQKWVFASVGASQYNMAVNLGPYCLDDNGGGQGAQAVVWSCDGSNNQKWTTASTDGGYTLTNAGNGMCLDVYGAPSGVTANNAKVASWPCGPNDAAETWSIRTR